MKCSLSELKTWIEKQSTNKDRWPNFNIGNILCTTLYERRLKFVTGGMSLDVLVDHPGLYFEIDETNRIITVNGGMAVKY